MQEKGGRKGKNEPKNENSRWDKQARVHLRNLMQSLGREDIGSALRVIIDAYGIQGSHIIRRGNATSFICAFVESALGMSQLITKLSLPSSEGRALAF